MKKFLLSILLVLTFVFGFVPQASAWTYAWKHLTASGYVHSTTTTTIYIDQVVYSTGSTTVAGKYAKILYRDYAGTGSTLITTLPSANSDWKTYGVTPLTTTACKWCYLESTTVGTAPEYWIRYHY